MTTDWIRQSSGLYRGKRERGVAPSLQVDGATRKTIEDCTRWCNQEEKCYGLKIEGRYRVWCNGEGNELTYHQVSRVTDTPDEVKTCPTH
jgi:hypothetical protein